MTHASLSAVLLLFTYEIQRPLFVSDHVVKDGRQFHNTAEQTVVRATDVAVIEVAPRSTFGDNRQVGLTITGQRTPNVRLFCMVTGRVQSGWLGTLGAHIVAFPAFRGLGRRLWDLPSHSDTALEAGRHQLACVEGAMTRGTSNTGSGILLR